MTFWTLYSVSLILRWSALLAGLYVSWRLWRKQKTETRSESQDSKARQDWTLFASMRIINPLAAILAFCLGYTVSEVVHDSSRHFLTNVRVLDRYDDFHYRIQVDYGEPYTIHFCDDYGPKFESGMTLQFLIYEDRPNCKTVFPKGTGFKVYRNIATGKFVDFRQEN